jgi:peptidoglycan hydrolase CwlO-like protein
VEHCAFKAGTAFTVASEKYVRALPEDDDPDADLKTLEVRYTEQIDDLQEKIEKAITQRKEVEAKIEQETVRPGRVTANRRNHGLVPRP